MAREAVSVVVCSRDRAWLLRDSLAALRRAVRPQDEVVVVDSASRSPKTLQIAEEAGFKVVRCELPGASRARNAGLWATSKQLVAFTDDDCLVDEGWTAAIRSAFEEERVGFVTGRVLPDRRSRLMLSVVVDDLPKRFRSGHDVFAIGTGANMAFRRDALESIGAFDEILGPGSLFHAAEDSDVWWRLLQGGWEGRYVPGALVVHRQWRSETRVLKLEYRYGIGAGALACKVARLNADDGRFMLREVLWRNGVLGVFRSLARGYEAAAVAAACRTMGAAVGALRARRLPLEDGRYRG